MLFLFLERFWIFWVLNSLRIKLRGENVSCWQNSSVDLSQSSHRSQQELVFMVIGSPWWESTLLSGFRNRLNKWKGIFRLWSLCRLVIQRNSALKESFSFFFSTSYLEDNFTVRKEILLLIQLNEDVIYYSDHKDFLHISNKACLISYGLYCTGWGWGWGPQSSLLPRTVQEPSEDILLMA